MTIPNHQRVIKRDHQERERDLVDSENSFSGLEKISQIIDGAYKPHLNQKTVRRMTF